MNDDLGTPHLRFEREGSIAWCTVNRPEARNALTSAMYLGVRRAVDRVHADPDLRALVWSALVPGTSLERSALYAAKATLEPSLVVEASLSKAMGAQIAQEVTTLGMELLGAEGARGDHLIEKLYRDAKAMDIVEGTGQIQRVIIARDLVNLPRR